MFKNHKKVMNYYIFASLFIYYLFHLEEKMIYNDYFFQIQFLYLIFILILIIINNKEIKKYIIEYFFKTTLDLIN